MQKFANTNMDKQASDDEEGFIHYLIILNGRINYTY